METSIFSSFSRQALVLATLSMVALSSCSKDDLDIQDSSSSVKQEAPMQQGRPSGEYIVVMKEGTAVPAGIKALPMGQQIKFVRELSQKMLQEHGIEGVDVDDDHTFSNIMDGFTAKLSAEQIAELKKDDRIAYIEEDKWVALADGTTNEVINYATQNVGWGVTKVGGIGDGTGKTAWIIDSGIDPNHSDLNVDKARSKSFLASTQGADYLSYVDAYGHGTQVAGIIGAKNNSIGVVGVAANANLVALRVIDANGSALTSRIIRALNWVATYGKPGDVVNYSIGGGISTTIDDAVKKVAAKGIYVAMAAGNSAADCINCSPQRVNATNLFTVSSMDNLSKLAATSNYGSPVDYAAPGINVITTNKGGTYAKVSGSSFAAPHLAGVLLLTGGKPKSSGYVSGDKDNKPDPISSK